MYITIIMNANAARIDESIDPKGSNCFSEGLCRVSYTAEAKISLHNMDNKYIYMKGSNIRKIAYIDRSGNVELDSIKICGLSCEIVYARNFSDGVAYIKFVEFKQVFDHVYKEDWINGKYPIKSGFIDKNGKILFLVDPEAKIRDFVNGRAAILRLGDKGWGFIDKTGRMVIEPQFWLGD